MTEVAKMLSGMAVPASDNASFLKHDQSKLVLEEFSGLMNQSAGNLFGRDLSFMKQNDNVSKSVFSLSDTTGNVQKDYAKFSQGMRTIAEAKTDTVNAADFRQKVSGLAQEVKDAVQETMQVSEEEFAEVMESLGFSPLDLLDPQNLIQVVQSIFGSNDVSALLVDANFQMALQEVTELVAAFRQENGLDAGTFGDLLAQLSAEIDKFEELVEEILQTGESSPEQAKEQLDQLLEEVFGVKEPENTAAVPEAASGETAEMVQTTAAVLTPEGGQPLAEETEEPEEETQIPLVGETAEQAAQSGDGENEMSFGSDSNLDSGRQEKLFQTQTQVEDQTAGVVERATMSLDTQIPVSGQMVPQPEVLQAAFSYLEVEQLMDQMEGLARAFASAEGTTLEMQLNPESLGKLFLTVTEKQGAVTAQIAASNEQVKEALQTQMVELRATLEAQGLKVEAVEVTVAAHEFEQNLDGNTSANGQMQQEQADRQGADVPGGRRNLNLNSLDELSGLMSEEEALVAQMMRDNGGTVDYIA